MLHTTIIYLNQFSQQNYFKIPKVSKYSLNSQYPRKIPNIPSGNLLLSKFPGNFASLVWSVVSHWKWIPTD